MNMDRVRHWLCSRNGQRWWVGLVLLVAVAALRYPWLEADAGAPGLWTYGSFSGDEGEYTGGGRLAYLTGKFYDPAMEYPNGLKMTPGMNFLGYVGYQICGLRYAAARLPVVTAAVIGWFLIYWLTARATAPWLAGAVTLAVSCNPINLMYERWGSSDVVFGVCMLVAFVLIQRRQWWWAAPSGVVVAFALGVKATAILLSPLVLLTLLLHRKHRILRWLCFCGACAGCYLAGQWLVHRCLVAAGGSPPPLGFLSWDLSAMVRAVSSFPRLPISTQLGPFVVWAMILPLWYVVITWYRTRRWLTRHGVVCLTVLIYLAVLATQPRNPLRYFLPVLYFCPLILVRCRALVSPAVRRAGMFGIALVAVTAILLWMYWHSTPLSIDELRAYVYNDYVVPAKPEWKLSGLLLLTGGLCVTVACTLRLGVRGGLRQWLMLGVLGGAISWFICANHVFAVAGLREGFVIDQTLLQLGAVGGLALVLGGLRWRRWWYWYGGWGVLLVGFVLLNSHWSQAYPRLMNRRYTVQAAARRVAGDLPPDALVYGRRAATLLRSTRLRVGSNPIYEAPTFVTKITTMMQAAPGRPLYWLIGADEFSTYVSPNDPLVRQRFKMKLIDTVPVPGDGSPAPVPLYVIRLEN